MASLNGHLEVGLEGVLAGGPGDARHGLPDASPDVGPRREGYWGRLASQFRLYGRAVSYFKQDWGLIALMLALVGVSIGLGLLLSWPMAVLIDSVLTPTPHADWGQRLFLAPLPKSMLGRVIGVTVISMLLWVAQHALTLVKAMLGNRINNFGVMRVRNEVFRKLQTLDLAFHQSQPQADAMYRVCNDTQGLQAILNVLLNALMAVVELAMMIGIMLSRNVPLTIYGLSVAPVLILINWKFGSRIRRRNITAKEVDTGMVSLVQRSMASMGLVQAFGRQHKEMAHFQASTLQTARAWLKLNWAQEAYALIVRTVFAVGGAVIFGYGGYLVWRDQFAHPVADGMTLGTLGVFMDYLTNKLWGPLNRLTSVGADIQPGVAGAQRVFEVLDRKPTITDRPNALVLPRQARTLDLREVNFEYIPGKPVLRDVTVSVPPGQMVAFVGSSGAGKSTLMNLLPRFYDPTAGSIELDGADVRNIRLEDLRRHIALVPQESLLLAATVAENIAYGTPDATREQIERAAELAGAAGFIDTLPLGYDTMVSEGGQNLSGGQRQRLSLARALLTEAPILVLDEPTSALDPHHEKLITETLMGLKGRRTIVLVSHRLGTVAGCDQIVVMEQGRVVEKGRHADLMAYRGYYSRMVKEQQGLDDTTPGRKRAA